MSQRRDMGNPISCNYSLETWGNQGLCILNMCKEQLDSCAREK